MITALSFSRRDRRAAVAGVSIISSIVLGAKVVPAAKDWQTHQLVQLRRAHAEIDRLRRGVAEKKQEHVISAKKNAAAGLDSSWLSAPDIGTLGAQLVSRLRSYAQEDDVSLRSIQPRSDSSHTPGIVLASARINLTADIEGLMGFLSDLEATVPLLRIVELTVNQDDVSAQSNRPDGLKVDMTVQALGLVGGTRAHVAH